MPNGTPSDAPREGEPQPISPKCPSCRFRAGSEQMPNGFGMMLQVLPQHTIVTHFCSRCETVISIQTIPSIQLMQMIEMTRQAGADRPKSLIA
jgi:hypothetical protein